MMQIFAWRTGAIPGYRQGTVAAIGASAGEARLAIMGDFPRWIKTGYDTDEHSPMAHYFDGITAGEEFPSWASEDERADMAEEIERHREALWADLQGDPITLPTGILYVWGGD